MRWDAKRRRYVDSRGRVLTPRQVRKQVEDYVETEEKRTEAEAAKMIAGTISATAFFLYMQNKIEAWHKVAGAIAYGGRAQMDATREARIDRIIESEQAYLSAFRDEVAEATELTEGVVNRAGMYPNAAYSTYENQVVQREADNGVTLGRRITEEDQNVCDGCMAAATEEYLPLGELLDIGAAECLNNCRCTIEFSYQGVEPLSIERDVYARTNILEAIQ